MIRRKITDLILIILPAAAAILNGSPNVVQMNWFGGYTTYCSGYSLLPMGYAIWGPMAAGVGAILLAVLGIVRMLRPGEKLRKWMLGIAVTALLMIVTTAIFGSMTVIGWIIAALLAADAVLLFLVKERK